MSTIREKGWLHKDDPINGIKIISICPECDGRGSYIHNGLMGVFDSEGQPVIEETLRGQTVHCPECENGQIERQLTIGEVLEMIKVLTTKDGRRVMREK